MDADFEITIVSRQESTASYPPAKIAKADYTLESLTEVFRGQDAVVSAVAVPAAAQQTAMIDACIAAGVKRFIPSYFGYALDNQPIADMVAFTEPKRNILAYLEDKTALEAAFTYSSVACGVFIDWVGLRCPCRIIVEHARMLKIG